MKITKLHIQNFLTISEAELALDDKGLVLIQGVNKDDPSATSNGAGKSTIPDALCWTLYGVTARGVTGDAVISKVAGKNCSVRVFIEDGKNKYSIHRFRKDALEKNKVMAFQTDASGAVFDLTKGTDRETQEIINQIMGCSYEVFTAAVYSGQERMADLPGMTDKNLKLIIEEAAGVDRLSRAYEIARTKAAAKQSEANAIASVLGGLGVRSVDETFELEGAEKKHEVFEEQRGEKRRAIVDIAKESAVAAKELAAEIGRLDEAKVEAELREVNDALIDRDRQDKELAALVSAENACATAASVAERLVKAGKLALEKAERDLANIDAKVGTLCSECGNEYAEEDMADVKVIAAEKVSFEKNLLGKAVEHEKTCTNELQAAHSASDEYRAGMMSFTELVAKQTALGADLKGIRDKKIALAAIKSELAGLVERSKAIATQENPWTEVIKVRKESLLSLAKESELGEEALAEKTAALEILNDAVKVFSPAGVRARILDTVTPFLNDRTSDYLGALSDGNISAVWSTLTRKANGELREKFNIEVVNDKGAESFAGLSGGEKRKVRLATAMALQDLVAGRASKPIELAIYDEIDDALDEAGLERLMGILERKARGHGTALVISHNSLGEWISNVIEVTKEGGVSTVSGVL